MSDIVSNEEKKQKMNKNMVEKSVKKGFTKVIVYMVFILFTILTIYPLIWLFYSSFKPNVEIIRHALALPKNPIITNYINAWRIGKLGLYAINSVIYTTISTAVTIILAMMASFAFAKIRYKITKFLYNLFLIGLLITLHSILVPLFLVETRIGLQDTHIGIIIPYIAISLPMAIYLGTEFVKGIPDSIIETAKIDGASYFQIFLRIILPMCRPVIVTIAIITVLANWNEFLLVFILTARDVTRSLPVGIYMFSGPLATEYGMQLAALVIGLAPILLFYTIFHKQITRGVVAGAIKG